MFKLKYFRRTLLISSQALLLQACVFLPKTVAVYDPECQAVAKQMVLQPVQIAAIDRCANQGCVALVVGAGVTAAASALVSGTIAIAGNIAYWLEGKAVCHRPG